MASARMNRDRRPIVYDNAFPLGGSRDRRGGRARDDGPLEARAALTDHLQKSMGSENYTKACFLLDYLVSALLGPDGGEGGESGAAMDARLLDRGQSQLAQMFPDSANPRLNFR